MFKHEPLIESDIEPVEKAGKVAFRGHPMSNAQRRLIATGRARGYTVRQPGPGFGTFVPVAGGPAKRPVKRRIRVRAALVRKRGRLSGRRLRLTRSSGARRLSPEAQASVAASLRRQGLGVGNSAIGAPRMPYYPKRVLYRRPRLRMSPSGRLVRKRAYNYLGGGSVGRAARRPGVLMARVQRDRQLARTQRRQGSKMSARQRRNNRIQIATDNLLRSGRAGVFIRDGQLHIYRGAQGKAFRKARYVVRVPMSSAQRRAHFASTPSGQLKNLPRSHRSGFSQYGGSQHKLSPGAKGVGIDTRGSAARTRRQHRAFASGKDGYARRTRRNTAEAIHYFRRRRGEASPYKRTLLGMGRLKRVRKASFRGVKVGRGGISRRQRRQIAYDRDFMPAAQLRAVAHGGSPIPMKGPVRAVRVGQRAPDPSRMPLRTRGDVQRGPVLLGYYNVASGGTKRPRRAPKWIKVTTSR